MAKNYEFYKDELISLFANGKALAVVDDHPRECDFASDCHECDLYRVVGGCNYARKLWLNAEHIEKPKLTKKERMFCELVETGWIARDEDGDVVYRPLQNTPVKADSIWRGQAIQHGSVWFDALVGTNDIFSFITWGDKEPWSVEELLKLEVMEG